MESYRTTNCPSSKEIAWPKVATVDCMVSKLLGQCPISTKHNYFSFRIMTSQRICSSGKPHEITTTQNQTSTVLIYKRHPAQPIETNLNQNRRNKIHKKMHNKIEKKKLYRHCKMLEDPSANP